MSKWSKFQRATRPAATDEKIAEFARTVNVPEAEIRKVFEQERDLELSTWLNDTYQVSIMKCQVLQENFPEMVHLSIKRRDREPIHDWRDLQRIKNELVGEENEAFELYPAESRVVDTANQYHLWVFKDPKIQLPVGWVTGMKFGTSGAGAKQRPFEE